MKLIISLCITATLIFSVQHFTAAGFVTEHARAMAKPAPPVIIKNEEKLKSMAAASKSYVRANRLNEDVCFLLDMSLPSGKNRFFIWDLKKDSLLDQGLVAHGNCYQYWLEGRQYSNKVGSGCTSLGHYKTGFSYTGKWGYAWKLHGLDSTNSNAFERAVVLHSHACVPEAETADEICQSNGCPTVSPGMLNKLKVFINLSRKPMLLYIYN